MCERGAQAVALDISTGILRDAEAQFASGVFFDRIAATMTALPFLDAIFDLVFVSAAVHHSGALKLAFSEFARVLKPGGKVILVNKPVQGILLYRLRDYRRAAAHAGLKTQVLFPADLDKQMRGQSPLPPSVPLLLPLGHWLIGLTLVMVAEKR